MAGYPGKPAIWQLDKTSKACVDLLSEASEASEASEGRVISGSFVIYPTARRGPCPGAEDDGSADCRQS